MCGVGTMVRRAKEVVKRGRVEVVVVVVVVIQEH